ncbi:MAG: HAMP domain-containing histidine kinase [Clostridia bacterium]|nr:HAMP domain-containing histidine kinase [Clostridia bacterium]
MKNKKTPSIFKFTGGNRRKNVISPWVLTIGVLGVWIVGIFLGNLINHITNEYLVEGQGKNFWIVIAYVTFSSAIGVGLAFLITHLVFNIVNEINVSINKIADGDFTVRIAPITKNPHINSAVSNFNEMVKKLNSVALLKNDFVSNFTHEFKTPISSIKGYAELLEASDNLTKEQREYLRIIIDESKSLSVLSENSMKLARLDNQTETTDLERFSLDGQIEDCILLLDSKLKEKNVDVELKLKPIKIKSDKNLLKEVWLNLLANAIKFSRKNGKIYVKTYREKDKVVVAIRDNGIGMTEEAQKHIFEKFYQVDKYYGGKGLGLGLSIVKRILELVGGQIEVESELDVGTEFRVYIK